MKRKSKQQQIGSRAEKIFESIIPDEWNHNALTRDYGTDYILDIFRNGESTGKSFFVQVKGSEQKIKNNTISIKLERDDLEHFNSVDLPMLLVAVSTLNKQIWVMWVNRLINVREFKKDFILTLSEEYLFDDGFFDSILDRIADCWLMRISSRFKTDKEKRLNGRYKQWVEHFYKDKVTTEFKYLPEHVKFIYKEQKQSISLKIINISGESKISIPQLDEENSYLYQPYFDEHDINEYNQDYLLALCFGLSQFNVKSSLVIFNRLLSHIDFQKPEVYKKAYVGLSILLHDAIRKDVLKQLDDLVKRIIDLKYGDLYSIITMVLLRYVKEYSDLIDIQVSNLQRAINSMPEGKGTFYYNLGNAYSRFNDIHDTREALSYYLRARKFEPTYLNRKYWWHEIGGLFFLAEHYKLAEYCYNKSLSLKTSKKEKKQYIRFEHNSRHEEYYTYPLIADTLFFQGKFTDALKWFDKYQKSVKYMEEEWFLKQYLCEILSDNNLSDIKRDQEKSAKITKQSYEEENPSLLGKAIELDPLNGLAWFNIGTSNRIEGDYKEAFTAFIMTTMVQDWDKEAIFNAVMSAFNAKNDGLLGTTISYMYKKYGYVIINEFTDFIMNTVEIEVEQKELLIHSFVEMFEYFKTQKDKSDSKVDWVLVS